MEIVCVRKQLFILLEDVEMFNLNKGLARQRTQNCF